jgi:hypothetical protein
MLPYMKGFNGKFRVWWVWWVFMATADAKA